MMKIINDYNRVVWQRSIGYVPQNIFIADDTIASNIAFKLTMKILIMIRFKKSLK